MYTDTKTAQQESETILGEPVNSFNSNTPFQLENGEILPELRIAYHTFGKLNNDHSNVVWVFHALTANANPIQWWPGLVGHDDLINPKDHFIVCANVIGSCYGSTGPKDFNPVNGERYLRDFPHFTIRDIVNAHKLLQQHLGIEKIFLGIGGSMGGQQLLEWAVQDQNLFENIALVATAARSSSWGIAIRSAQRMAIEADPSFYSSSPKGGWKGLEAARAMAMTSYRTHQSYNEAQQDPLDKLDNFRAESYQRYQGEKLRQRFDARSYYALSKAMDTHNLGRGRGSVNEALNSIKSRALVIGIEGDLLFTADEQRIIADNIQNSRLAFVPSKYGHDGFLIESQNISIILKNFLKEHS